MAARTAATAGARSGRRRHRGRPDQGRDGDRQGAYRRAASANSWRGATRWRSCSRSSSGSSASICGPTTGGTCRTRFAILLNYTELALISVGLSYVIAAGDIDLSVGAVLALAGSAAAYSLKVLGLDPWSAIVTRACSRASLPAPSTASLTVWLRPAGVHRHARHVLHRARPCLVDRRRPAAHRLHRELQPDRPQGRRYPDLHAYPASERACSAPSPMWSACRRSG